MHVWMGAAAMLQADAIPNQTDVLSGKRDLSALLLVQAARNAYRGAVSLLGAGSSAVQAFNRAQPEMRDLRDRLEHFDAYVVGDGFAQKAASVALGDRAGLVHSMSSGSGDSHSLTIESYEGSASESRIFTITTEVLVEDLRQLVASAMDTVHARHDLPCPVCGGESARQLDDPRDWWLVEPPN